MKNGFENEVDFVNLFNNKKLSELDVNSQKFIKEAFEDIDDKTPILAWKNKVNQKSDIFIRHKNIIKGISLKCGHDNSVHSESIQDFKMFLESIGIKYSIIKYYVNYHYGYKRDENDNILFEKMLDSDEYKKYYQKEIDIFNKEVNKTKIIIQLIDRFIIQGRNSKYDIDYLISGTPEDYIWINKYDIYDLILEEKDKNFTSPHFGAIMIGPKKRCIDGKNNIRDRYVVSGRWNYMKESIIEFKKNHNN